MLFSYSLRSTFSTKNMLHIAKVSDGVIMPLGDGLTLKNRRRYSTVYSLAARKNTSRKKRLIKRTRQNRPVPAWVIIRTHRHVRTNPKRRLWRRTDVNVG